MRASVTGYIIERIELCCTFGGVVVGVLDFLVVLWRVILVLYIGRVLLRGVLKL